MMKGKKSTSELIGKGLFYVGESSEVVKFTTVVQELSTPLQNIRRNQSDFSSCNEGIRDFIIYHNYNRINMILLWPQTKQKEEHEEGEGDKNTSRSYYWGEMLR